ncbi:MAG: bifunctional alpha,alpha-trehalose-phosphate synthase (UDP-forming)/trehalose-phosphatase [Nitrospirota bacterium]
MQDRRLIIVANRLPFTAVEEGGTLHLKESPGGLVSALNAYFESLHTQPGREREYLWIGWPGGTVSETRRDELTVKALEQFHSHPVFLSQEEMDAFYLGFCNKTLWPLFHYFPSYCSYQEEFWQQYLRVNEMFSQAVTEILKPDDIVWVHDYHLMLLPKLLRVQAPDTPIGFFLHTPFPSFELFRLLPGSWRRDILEGLLGADLNGFHTYDDAQHFLQSVLRILGYEHQMGQITTPERIVKAGAFPISIDFTKFSEAVDAPEVQREREELKQSLPRARIILSVDRLDYSKGILNRLQGFERLLETHPSLRERVVIIMVVVPSRIGVHQYDLMKKQIEELVGKINGRFGNVGWTPIVYQYRSLSFAPLVALYGLSDVALVTPLRDGMNLVAKEYVASRHDRTGVLILSEMSGAAKELGEAIIINPNNIEEIAEALREALEMAPEEQRRRNAIMQDRLRRYDVVRWADDFVQELTSMAQAQNKFYAKLLPRSVAEQMAGDYRRALRRLILLDYDGTLVPLVRHPDLAKPGPDVMGLLRRLSEDPRNTCVLISGRTRETLQRWFGGLSLNFVAEHGIWIKEANADWTMLAPHTNEWKPALMPMLQLHADRLPGSFVEEKEHSVSWHYRLADPEQGQWLAGELTDQLVNFTANMNLQVMRGHKVIEVRRTGANKGGAALHWLSRKEHDFILALGDDWTDEDLFAALPDAAYSLRVGITTTHARYNLKGVGDAIRLLAHLAEPPPAA